MLYQLSYRRKRSRIPTAARLRRASVDEGRHVDRGRPSGTTLPCVRRSAVPIVVAVLGAALVALLVYGVVARHDDTSLDSAVKKGELPAAPGSAVPLPTLEGSGTQSLASLRGKVVVLNFWASWCPPCEHEAPVLERAQKQLAASGGTVLGVTYKDDASSSRDFVRQHKLSYPSVRDDRLDLAPKYGTTALPETFVLDKQGRIVALSRGEVNEKFLANAIDRAQKS
jgi:cytochrome c biogenesis protein CcmG, thiol:disulfide interchange protein DsbE